MTLRLPKQRHWPLTNSWPHARPAADNLQHPGHHLHRRERPQTALPGPALRPLLQRPQGPQHGRRGPRQHQGERQRATGGRRADQQGSGAHHHLGATRDVHHLHWDHHHAVHHHHPQAALTTDYPGRTVGQEEWVVQRSTWSGFPQSSREHTCTSQILKTFFQIFIRDESKNLHFAIRLITLICLLFRQMNSEGHYYTLIVKHTIYCAPLLCCVCANKALASFQNCVFLNAMLQCFAFPKCCNSLNKLQHKFFYNCYNFLRKEKKKVKKATTTATSKQELLGTSSCQHAKPAYAFPTTGWECECSNVWKSIFWLWACFLSENMVTYFWSRSQNVAYLNRKISNAQANVNHHPSFGEKKEKQTLFISPLGAYRWPPIGPLNPRIISKAEFCEKQAWGTTFHTIIRFKSGNVNTDRSRVCRRSFSLTGPVKVRILYFIFYHWRWAAVHQACVQPHRCSAFSVTLLFFNSLPFSILTSGFLTHLFAYRAGFFHVCPSVR